MAVPGYPVIDWTFQEKIIGKYECKMKVFRVLPQTNEDMGEFRCLALLRKIYFEREKNLHFPHSEYIPHI